MTTLLRQHGFQNVCVTYSAVEALCRMNQEGDDPLIPDLILMNYLMPGMDGIEACRRIKSNKKLHDIPIIMMSSTDSDEQIKKAFDAGASDFVSIPIREVELIARMETALRRKCEMKQLNKEKTRLKELTYRDSLTGVHNRRYFDELLTREWRRSARFQRALSLIMIDIDDFKRFNDHYGHALGDDCLRKVADALRRTIRVNDILCRYGGEEFVAILPETDQIGALKVAQKLLEAVQALQIPHEDSETSAIVTISAGCCGMIPESREGKEKLIEGADQALYLAKKKGRNQICFAD